MAFCHYKSSFSDTTNPARVPLGAAGTRAMPKTPYFGFGQDLMGACEHGERLCKSSFDAVIVDEGTKAKVLFGDISLCFGTKDFS